LKTVHQAKHFLRTAVTLSLKGILSRKGTGYLFLLSAFLVVNALLYWQNGIRVVSDTPRYMEYAKRLEQGFYFDHHNFWYIGYVVYIFITQWIDEGYNSIVLGQYLLSLFSVLALYQAARFLWPKKRYALLSALLLILFIDVPMWNSYVLTESLYVSFTCFSIYGIVLILKKEKPTWFIVLTSLIILFTVLVKPTGIALLGAVSIVFASRWILKIRNELVKYAISVCLLISFASLLNTMLETYLIMDNYQLGEIIYDVTTLPDQLHGHVLIISPPENSYQPPDHYPQLAKIVLFFLHHPIYWTELFVSKIFYLLFHIRPFWSWSHNLFSLVVLIPCYYFAIQIIFRERSVHKQISLFAMVYLLIHILSVGITSEDWDGRFLMPMLPVVFLFAGRGMGLAVEKIGSKLLEC
jgi:hypothetical protein